MFLSRLKSPFKKLTGTHEKETGSNSRNKSNVNEEYMEAFRTKSYVEMYNKVQSQLGISTSHADNVGPSSSSYHQHQSIHLSNDHSLVDIIRDSNFHHLILDYLEVDLEACKLCEELLQVVHQTRSNHRIIKRVMKLAKRVNEFTDNNAKNKCIGRITMELASYSLLKNPLSSFSQAKFHDTQYSHGLLFKKLISKHRRIRRIMKLIKCFKRFMGCTLVVTSTALAIILLVLVFHSLVGIMASPTLIGCSLGFIKKKHQKISMKDSNEVDLERLGTQLDVAARGVYMLINDFDTMSRLMWRLYDEIEHGKGIANMCIRNGKGEVMKEVVKEFESHESCFVEMLKEFEEHIYLCLLNINRSRRQLVEEIFCDSFSVVV